MFLIHITDLVAATSEIKLTSLPGQHAGFASTDEIKIILQIVFGIIGAISLLIIAIGGLRYVLSAGDPGKITTAKNTILYAVVGIVVAASAETIVSFVLRNV